MCEPDPTFTRARSSFFFINMPPKKKASAADVPSMLIPPPPEQTGGGVDAGGRTDADEGAHGDARSKDKAAQTSASVHAPRPSQEARDQ